MYVIVPLAFKVIVSDGSGTRNPIFGHPFKPTVPSASGLNCWSSFLAWLNWLEHWVQKSFLSWVSCWEIGRSQKSVSLTEMSYFFATFRVFFVFHQAHEYPYSWLKSEKNVQFRHNGPINLLSDRLLRYVLIFEYQILGLDLVVDIRTKISEGIWEVHLRVD